MSVHKSTTGDDCTAYIEGSFSATSGAGCVTTSSVSSGWNNLTLADGLQGEATGNCDLKVGVYLDASDGGGCLQSGSINGGWNSLSLADGLVGEVTGDCSLKIGAAFGITTGNYCIDNSTTEGATWNTLDLGYGFNVEATGDCALSLQVGLHATADTGCITEKDGLGWNSGTWTNLDINEGLGAEFDDAEDGCATLKLGLALNVNDLKVHTLEFSDCFILTESGLSGDGDSCKVGIDLNGSGGQFDFVHCVYCSGTGVFYNTSTAVFNDCGLFSGVISGADCSGS